jgi:hypothetical protein
MVKEGSKWASTGDNNKFHVIHVIEIEGHTWVHYIKENAPEDSNREYSCYLESFLQRFRPLPE